MSIDVTHVTLVVLYNLRSRNLNPVVASVGLLALFLRRFTRCSQTYKGEENRQKKYIKKSPPLNPGGNQWWAKIFVLSRSGFVTAPALAGAVSTVAGEAAQTHRGLSGNF